MAKPNTQALTRAKLLDQGVAFLTEYGYHGSGLQDILAAVKVPKGSFYHYFASKEAFGAAVIAHYIEPFIAELDLRLAEPSTLYISLAHPPPSWGLALHWYAKPQLGASRLSLAQFSSLKYTSLFKTVISPVHDGTTVPAPLLSKAEGRAGGASARHRVIP